MPSPIPLFKRGVSHRKPVRAFDREQSERQVKLSQKPPSSSSRKEMDIASNHKEDQLNMFEHMDVLIHIRRFAQAQEDFTSLICVVLFFVGSPTVIISSVFRCLFLFSYMFEFP